MFSSSGFSLKSCNSVKSDSNSTLKNCNSVKSDSSWTLKSCNSVKSDSNLTLKSCTSEKNVSNSTMKSWTPEKNGLPKVGSRLDVKSLLSNNGKTTHLVRSNGESVGFDAVLGKHLLICTVSLPLNEGYHYFQAMLDTYSGLSRDCYEMVVVASSDSAKSAFDDFFSELPCLAVPFSESDTRHSICSFIPLIPSSFCPKAFGLLLDPAQIILHYQCHEFFLAYGVEWFPFTDAGAIEIQDYVLRFRLDPLLKKSLERVAPRRVLQDPLIGHPLSLHEDILQCPPSLTLHRISLDDGPVESISVSELSNKHVGLYLCFQKDFYPELIPAYQQCIANGQELEILVIFIPIHEDINDLYETLKRHTQAENITPSWFVFPHNDKVWRRLWRVFTEGLYEDTMIFLPPNGKPGELEGKAVIRQLGIQEYPFTRSSIRDKRFTALRSLTPASLFKGATEEHTCLVRRGKKVDNVLQSALEGKKLLVYLAWLRLSDDHGKFCRWLMKLYPKIRAMGCEVVFVPLDCKVGGRRHAMYGKMPWPIMPVRTAIETSIVTKLICAGEDYRHVLIAFGKDGQILSRRAKKGLKKNGLGDFLFRDNLYEEIDTHLSSLRDEPF